MMEQFNTYYNGSCFKHGGGGLYGDMKAVCEASGGFLAVLYSKTALYMLRDRIPKFGVSKLGSIFLSS